MKLSNLWMVALFAALFSSTPNAGAWGPDGHRIVAHIAELRLTDQAHRVLTQLLEPGQQISDNLVCNWPDYIRHEQPETAPWHYVDIPCNATNYDPEIYCPTGQCIVSQIAVLESRLADTNLPVAERNIALRFLVHFMGDLHQPLHCADNDEDRGGNERPVLYPGHPEPTNLHAVWDLNLVHASMAPLGALEFADKLNTDISKRRARKWAKGSIEGWAWESHELAVQKVYSILPPKGGPPAVVDAAYIKSSQRIVEQQLMKAGVRLAAVLNRALQTPLPTPPATPTSP